MITLQKAGEEDTSITYKHLIEGAAGYAKTYAQCGIQPGEVVILILQHGIDLVYAFWGAILHGAIPSIMPYLTEKLLPERYRHDLEALISVTQPVAIVTYPEFEVELKPALKEGDSVRALILSNSVEQSFKPDFDQLGGLQRDPDDIVLLQHSSGTTGLQKGVALSHQAVFNQLANLCAALDYIKADSSIREVILSGGDPLTLNEPHLETLSQQLSRIPHVSRLRIHTRTPIVLPERINNAFLNWLQNLPLETIMVLHCNHPKELSEPVRHALQRLHQTGLTLLNQAVLLKGVNDDIETLTRLSEHLFSNKVLPYYLHQLDRVQGAAHFEVDDEYALALSQQLREQLPGYLVPQLVREIASEKAKMPLVK